VSSPSASVILDNEQVSQSDLEQIWERREEEGRRLIRDSAELLIRL